MNNSSFFSYFHQELDYNITLEELLASIKKSKRNKAVGLDYIPNDRFKFLPNSWIHYILSLFNRVWNSENIPSEWSKIKLKMFFKKEIKPNMIIIEESQFLTASLKFLLQ